MRKLIVANWKENKNLKEVRDWLNEFEKLIDGKRFNVDIVIAPSHSHVCEVSRFSRKYDFIYTSAQDVSAYIGGAHTGEVGVLQLVDYCDYCIVGHSERGEGRDVVYQKAAVCFESGIKPIVCFVDYKDAGSYYASKAVLAWEDPENISKRGVFNPKDPLEIEKAVKYMKKQLPDAMILYGGSVNKDNSKNLAKISELDGVLIGSSSLDANHFYSILESFN